MLNNVGLLVGILGNGTRYKIISSCACIVGSVSGHTLDISAYVPRGLLSDIQVRPRASPPRRQNQVIQQRARCREYFF